MVAQKQREDLSSKVKRHLINLWGYARGSEKQILTKDRTCRVVKCLSSMNAERGAMSKT